MDLLEKLKLLGVDTDEGLKHFKGLSSLYEKFLKKAPATIRGLEVESFLKSGDKQRAFENAHSLKGVCGNLLLTPLFNGYTEIVVSMRSDDYEKAWELLQKMLPIQEKILKAIEES